MCKKDVLVRITSKNNIVRISTVSWLKELCVDIATVGTVGENNQKQETYIRMQEFVYPWEVFDELVRLHFMML